MPYRAAIALVAAACGSSATAEKLQLPVVMEGDRCEIIAPDSRKSVEDWIKSQPRKRLRQMEITIIANTDTPYKCVGAAIFLLQGAGARQVGFIAEPPPER